MTDAELTVPEYVLNKAQEYANYTIQEIVVYREPTVMHGWDYMTKDTFVSNGNSLDDVKVFVYPN